MRRRSFLSLLPAMALPLPLSAAETVKPQRLKPGDTVGLVAPSSNAWEDEDIRFGIETVESLGYKVKAGRHLFSRTDYLAGSDEERAADLQAAFEDDAVDAVFCIRGGYGAQRILPYLDFDAIGKNPKILLGFSDITALLGSIQRRTGLVTFHGPTALRTWSEYALGGLRKVLVEPSAPVRLAEPPPFEARPGKVERENRLTTIVGGKARGKLAGGNLTLLSTLLGTPYAPDFTGKILFIEDVDESPYRIDRMLTHLWLAGVFEACAAVAVGKFTESKPGSGRSRSLEEILRDRLEPLGKPALRGLMIGHVDDLATIPVGAEAELDADAGTLTLLETAVT
ncbi:MAG: LD-carboxypeptidase [Acidobacteria bacterium]|nr:LD-carboxypeptidase [Acidobacteriota bacterium]